MKKNITITSLDKTNPQIFEIRDVEISDPIHECYLAATFRAAFETLCLSFVEVTFTPAEDK